MYAEPPVPVGSCLIVGMRPFLPLNIALLTLLGGDSMCFLFLFCGLKQKRKTAKGVRGTFTSNPTGL